VDDAKDWKKQIDQARHLGVLKVELFHMNRSRRYLPALDGAAEEAHTKISEKALKGRAVDCRVG